MITIWIVAITLTLFQSNLNPSKCPSPPHLQITSVAQVVLDMVHVALSESCGIHEMSPEDRDGTCAEPGKVLTPPPSVARELFRTARDMIELFWAVVPVHHRFLY